jgi:hypothetical protein
LIRIGYERAVVAHVTDPVGVLIGLAGVVQLRTVVLFVGDAILIQIGGSDVLFRFGDVLFRFGDVLFGFGDVLFGLGDVLLGLGDVLLRFQDILLFRGRLSDRVLLCCVRGTSIVEAHVYVHLGDAPSIEPGAGGVELRERALGELLAAVTGRLSEAEERD